MEVIYFRSRKKINLRLEIDTFYFLPPSKVFNGLCDLLALLFMQILKVFSARAPMIFV